jgi:hypothetical protein
VKKDSDLIMIASWTSFKRHGRFFSALAKAKKIGRVLRTILVGYPGDHTLADISRLAKEYEVDDQIELYEWLKPAEVNQHLNRAKVNVVWSRKEGSNRAIIEGMFAGVPCVLREGFNYGHPYQYINPATGCFAGERELPDKLVWMTDHYHEFSPRPWVMKNMTCQRATEILEDHVREQASARGESWTGGLAVKVSYLTSMRYWDEADRERFEGDYQFLRSSLRMNFSKEKVSSTALTA